MADIKLTDIKLNESNPRFIKDDNFDKLKKSIETHPKFMELRPIVVDNDNVILGGNMRFRALKDLGYKKIPEKWVKKASELTESEKKAFIIKDNVGFGDWNYEMLANEWDVTELSEWGVILPDWGENEMPDKKDLSEKIQNTFKIEVECKTENEQQILFEKLIKDGYLCRILTL